MLLVDHSHRRSDCSRRRQFMPFGWLALLILSLLLSTVQQTTAVSAAAEAASAQCADPDRKDDAPGDKKQTKESDAKKREERAKSVRALLAHLGLGTGSTVADVGAGKGQDTWVFAEVVGETGTVYAEEIEEGLVKSLKEEAEKKGLSQVRPVLGREDAHGAARDAVLATRA